MNKTVKKWLSRLGIGLLILISLALIFNRQIKDWMVASYNPKVTQETVIKNKKKKASYDFSAVKSLDWSTVARTRAKSSDIQVIGEIAYPDVKMHLPVANGVANETLALAAGTLKPDQEMGQRNFAIAGHHMVSNQALFSPLYWKARVGQKVYLTDLSKVYEYQVNVRKFIDATDVQVIDDIPHERILTMITCDATGARRLMVRAKYVKTYDQKDAPSDAQKMFAQKFNQQ
ncbi:class A sortase [Pediococcus argentinicus]|uniref:class A sortase n=1 Tax=Pediococcus argentinicus TaxID=480391 RepID=UPI0033907456